MKHAVLSLVLALFVCSAFGADYFVPITGGQDNAAGGTIKIYSRVSGEQIGSAQLVFIENLYGDYGGRYVASGLPGPNWSYLGVKAVCNCHLLNLLDSDSSDILFDSTDDPPYWLPMCHLSALGEPGSQPPGNH
ncbi:MAG: hypothetical protein K8R90_10750 [Candidatus Cloacimonetes bacterium]|nr:hypothetical protein [Candidatus Cloacimonadota bacterium]